MTRPEISAPEFEIWQDFIWKRCGLYFTPNRLDFLGRRLWERMQPQNLGSYNEYYHFVAYNPAGEEEWQSLLALLLNHETSFFRHTPSFTALSDYVLPRLMEEKEKQGVTAITMWSVGCSTGQEPYSLAMAFLEYMASAPLVRLTSKRPWRVKIAGSDLSQAALDKARRGRYKQYELRHLTDQQREQYLDLVEPRQNGQSVYKVTKQVQTLVQFGSLNLHQPKSYWGIAQDIIFCQNVLIYFKPEQRVEIVQRLSQRLNPGGYLFLGPAELLGLKLPWMQLIRLKDVLIYQCTD